MGFGSPLAISTADRIASLPGVDVVVPGVSLLMSDQASTCHSGSPMIEGQLAGADRGRETFPLHYASGRALTPGDEGSNVTVVGSDIARQHNLRVGDTLPLRGEAFTVVGILEPTLTAPDTTAIVPLAAGQRLFVSIAANARLGQAGPGGDRQRADRLPAAGGRSRDRRGRDHGVGPGPRDDDERGLRPPGRLVHLDPQLRSWWGSR